MYQKLIGAYQAFMDSRRDRSNKALLAAQGIPEPIVKALEDTVQELSMHHLCSPRYRLDEVDGKIYCSSPGAVDPYITLQKCDDSIVIGYDWDIPRTGMVVKERFGRISGVEIKEYHFNPLYDPTI